MTQTIDDDLLGTVVTQTSNVNEAAETFTHPAVVRGSDDIAPSAVPKFGEYRG